MTYEGEGLSDFYAQPQPEMQCLAPSRYSVNVFRKRKLMLYLLQKTQIGQPSKLYPSCLFYKIL